MLETHLKTDSYSYLAKCSENRTDMVTISREDLEKQAEFDKWLVKFGLLL